MMLPKTDSIRVSLDILIQIRLISNLLDWALPSHLNINCNLYFSIIVYCILYLNRPDSSATADLVKLCKCSAVSCVMA